MNIMQLKRIIEGALLAAGEPLTLDRIAKLFAEDERPSEKDLQVLLEDLASDYKDRAYELSRVSSGYRLQVRADLAPWISKLWEERPPRYSRALLETLALIAYRQPITRAEIEEIRGVVVSTSIMKTLLEREWVKVVGQRDVPGKPALYATTKQFLDYFNLQSLSQLPILTDIHELETMAANLTLPLSNPDIDKVAEEAAVEAEPASEQIIAENVESMVAEKIDEPISEQIAAPMVEQLIEQTSESSSELIADTANDELTATVTAEEEN